MRTLYVTELKVKKKAIELGIGLQVIRPPGRANRYEFLVEGKRVAFHTGARAAMEWLEEEEQRVIDYRNNREKP